MGSPLVCRLPTAKEAYRPTTAWRRKKKGSESLLTEIRIRKGETLDKALRRLKKRLDRENVIKDARNNRYYEKPSVRRRRKMKVAKFSQMLRTRYANNS